MEADEEVEHVDSEAIGDDVEALNQVYAQNVDKSDDQGTNPAAEHIRRGLVEETLRDSFIIMDDLANPYFLHQVDGLGLVLVSQSITGDNYDSWSCSLELALSVKNKLGFVDGSLPHPSADNPQQVTLWTRSDNVVLSHIFNSLSKDIVGSVMRSRVVSEVWQDLRECFQQRNGPRIFQLRRNLMALSQGSDSISVYFTKLKSIWDELSAYRPIVQCRCGGLRSLQNFYDSEYTMSFLMELNEHFSAI
ncbi:uncharacterized protein [Arachis hypogaea]|uniref:uncharacterized protein n=1 Tax=Arachis hypogaea TaxID=3818 RepID=UPI000DEC132B|nr:uncharacterized protein LOC112727537 [Arachis hypogaea]